MLGQVRPLHADQLPPAIPRAIPSSFHTSPIVTISQHMALIAASGGSLGLDRDIALLQSQLQQFRSSGVCRVMHP